MRAVLNKRVAQRAVRAPQAVLAPCLTHTLTQQQRHKSSGAFGGDGDKEISSLFEHIHSTYGEVGQLQDQVCLSHTHIYILSYEYMSLSHFFLS